MRVIVNADPDEDAVDDPGDNCPFAANSDQADADGDNQGDACDGDLDGDGAANTPDQCDFTLLGEVVDLPTGCWIADLVPCTGPWGSTEPWQSHGAYVSSVAMTAQSFIEQGLITPADRGAIKAAAQSTSCGQK